MNENILYNESKIKKIINLKFRKNVALWITFLLTNFVINNAHAGTLDDFVQATKDMTDAIKGATTPFIVLGLTVILACLILYIYVPKLRHTFQWVFGVITTIIVFAIILQYFSEPIKNMLVTEMNIFSLIPGIK